MNQHISRVHEEIDCFKSPESGATPLNTFKPNLENMTTPKNKVPKKSRVLFSSGVKFQKASKSNDISLEATIKIYRYITNHLSRHSSFDDNCFGCLKVLNICSLQSIKKFNSKEKIEFPLKDDEESNLMRSFFQNGNSSNLVDMKWDTSTFN